MLAIAALLVALRVALKSVQIPVGENLNITIGFFINALGAMIFGPVTALAAAAVSDTLGALLFPVGPYFFPFIFVEMIGSLIFALMLYRTKITASRIILSRFLVVFFCNLVLNPLIMIPYYKLFYDGKAYAFFTTARLIKNLALFPLEALLLVLFLRAVVPVTNRMGLTYTDDEKIHLKSRDIILLVILALVAAAAVIGFYFYKFGSLQKLFPFLYNA